MYKALEVVYNWLEKEGFLSTKVVCIPEFRGPGLYRANKAVISSNFVGFNFLIRSLIPVDSN